MIKTLKQDPSRRSRINLQILVDVLKETKFFQSKKGLSEEAYNSLALEMEYQFYPKGAMIFDYGQNIIYYIYRILWRFALFYS